MRKTALAVMMLMAVAANAAILTWSGATGSYGDPANWGGSAPAAGDELRISNGGTATITTGNTYVGGKLLLGRGAGGVGNLSMSGGSLTLDLLPSLSIADGSGSSSTLDMTGTSAINATGNILIGARSAGTMNVGSDASVSSATLFFSSAAGGAGTLNLAGDWSASAITMGHATLAVGNTAFNLNGGSVTSTGAFTVNTQGSHALTVNGSAGSFDSSGNFTANLGNFTLGFVADAGGFTTLDVGGVIDITDAVLNVDLASYGSAVSSLILMDGASLAGTFSSVNITGGTGSESIFYDTDNGNVVLIPEPASIGLIVLAGAALFAARKIAAL